MNNNLYKKILLCVALGLYYTTNTAEASIAPWYTGNLVYNINCTGVTQSFNGPGGTYSGSNWPNAFPSGYSLFGANARWINGFVFNDVNSSFISSSGNFRNDITKAYKYTASKVLSTDLAYGDDSIINLKALQNQRPSNFYNKELALRNDGGMEEPVCLEVNTLGSNNFTGTGGDANAIFPSYNGFSFESANGALGTLSECAVSYEMGTAIDSSTARAVAACSRPTLNQAVSTISGSYFAVSDVFTTSDPYEVPTVGPGQNFSLNIHGYAGNLSQSFSGLLGFAPSNGFLGGFASFLNSLTCDIFGGLFGGCSYPTTGIEITTLGGGTIIYPQTTVTGGGCTENNGCEPVVETTTTVETTTRSADTGGANQSHITFGVTVKAPTTPGVYTLRMRGCFNGLCQYKFTYYVVSNTPPAPAAHVCVAFDGTCN